MRNPRDRQIIDALRVAKGGEVMDDDESRSDFLKRELEGSAPQYDPEGGWKTAKEAGREIANLTTPGAIADAAGMLGAPSIKENIGQGKYLDAALQAAGVVPVFGPLAKGAGAAHLAMAMVPKATAVEDALRIARKTNPTISSVLEEKYPNVDFVLGEKDSGPLTLNRIVVPKEQRGQGIGTNFMNDLLAHADESGRKVALSPSSDFGGNKNKLNEWYKSLGFVPNKGRTKDFSFRETMYREPKSQENSQELLRQERANEQGYTGPWYHGSQRTDRLLEGKSINPKRATSGPMPFFTDDPEVASRYAIGKQDTSRIAMDEGNPANYFTVHPKELGISGRNEIPVEQSWYNLPQETKQKILENYGRIGYANQDEAIGDLVLHPEFGGLSSPSHYDYILKREAKGNPLTALRNIWYEGGDLYNNPEQLADIYRLAGYPHPISQKNAPWTEAQGVMPAMLRMENPLTTHNVKEINEKVIPHLEQAFAKDRTKKPTGSNTDMWDKNYKYTPKEWVAQLKEDMAKGDNSYAWTSIPDKVTKQLKALGYDGIIDTGGKMGGQEHRVAIPFHSHQVRSKFAKFNPKHLGKADLLKSNGGEVENALRLASGGGAWTRKEGKNPEGGLNEKGRASLRAQGHDIKRPQPEGGPRKDSFCARMKGMKAKLTSSETASDPDSRINKSLRKWNCRADGGSVMDALRLTRGSGGRSDKKSHDDVIGSVEPMPDYMRPFKELSEEKKAEALLHRFNSFSPKTGRSATTPRSTSEMTPKVSPEQYRRGNLGDGDFALATGGRAGRRGYAFGGNPTDTVAGTNPQTTATTSPYSSYVASLYNNILGRQADTGGQQYWEGQLGKGLTNMQNMLSNFAGSQEYQNLYKTDPTKAVAGMYQAAMSRAPDQAGLEYWTGQAKQGLDANKLASQFAVAPEFQNRNAIFNSYLNYTGQAPNQEQYASASKSLASGKTLSDVEQQIASSPQANANFVRSAYEGLLGQIPNQVQVQKLTDQLNSGELTQQNLLNMLASSSQGAEYANEQTLINAFKGAMNRAPTQAEQNYYLPQLAENKITQDQLFQAVRDTPEAQDYSNTRLVKDTFKALTGQTPDQATLQKYIDQITSGELDSGKLWAQLEATPESQKWAANTPKGSFDDVIGRFGQAAKDLTGLGKEAATKVGGLWDQIIQINPDLAGSLTSLIGLESGRGGLTAQAGNSSAAGLGQQTTAYIAEQMNKMFGTNYTAANLPEDIKKAITSTDPSSQALSLASFLQGTLTNAQKLQNNGIPVNEKSLYALHNLGPGGGMAFLNAMERNPNATMGSIAKALGGGNYSQGMAAIRGNSKLYPQGASTKIGEAFDNFSRLLDPKQTPEHQEWGTNVINQLGEIADKAKPSPTTPVTPPGGSTPDIGNQGTLNLPEYDKALAQYQTAYNDWKNKSDLYLVQEMSYGNKNPQLPAWWPAQPAQPNKGQFAKDAYEAAVKQYVAERDDYAKQDYHNQMIAQSQGWSYTSFPFTKKPPDPSNYGFAYNADNKNWSFTGTVAAAPSTGGNIGQGLAGQGAGGNVAGNTGGGAFGGVQPGVIPGITGNADLAASLAQQSTAQQADYLAKGQALALGLAQQGQAVAEGAIAASRNALQNYLNQTGSAGLSYLMGFGPPPTTSYGSIVIPPPGFGPGYGGGGGGYGGTGSVTYAGGGGGTSYGSGGFSVGYMNKGGAVWDKPRPKSLGKPDPLSKKQKSSAKAMAKAAGRPYPNLIDNMRAARQNGGSVEVKSIADALRLAKYR